LLLFVNKESRDSRLRRCVPNTVQSLGGNVQFQYDVHIVHIVTTKNFAV